MAVSAWRALLAMALAAQSAAIRSQVPHPVVHGPSSSGEPTGFQQIQKVARQLQDMKEKATKVDDAEEEHFEKYLWYCKSYGKELSKRISAAEEKVPGLKPAIKAAEMEKAMLDKDVQKARSDHAEAKEYAAEATAKREREAAAMAQEKGEYETNIAAIQDAIRALKSGAYASFMQTGAGATLRKTLAASGQLPDDAAMDMPELVSFLTGAEVQGANHEHRRVEAIAVLEQLAAEMTKALNQIVDASAKAAQAYEAAMAAKQKEIGGYTESIERKMGRSADLGVSIVSMQNDISDTQAALVEDKRFAEHLNATCANTTSVWEETTKLRKEELAAIVETINMLSDDGASEVLRATSFMDLAGSNGSKARALQILHTVSKKDHALFAVRMEFIGLALEGKKVGVDKVVKMIDDMANIIEGEQLADESKMEYCDKRFNSFQDKTEKLDGQPGLIQKAMADTEEDLKVVTEMIAGSTQSIAELDRQVADATEQRKQDHEVYLKQIHGNTAAKQLLGLAKKRLLQFYTTQPQTTNATAPAREDQLDTAFGGTVAVLTQVAAVARHKSALELSKVRPPPPEGPAAYSKMAEEGAGVINLIGSLVEDLDTEITQAESDEDSNQESYEALLTDSVNQRDHDTRILTGEIAAKANLEAELERHRNSQTASFNGTQAAFVSYNQTASLNDTKATSQFLAHLHAECDWFHKYYSTRKAGRATETDALAKAKAVLNGVSPSLVQASKGKGHRHRRPRAVQQAK